MSPAERETMSPGTRSLTGISCVKGWLFLLILMTAAVICTSDLSFSAALPDRYSWVKRMSTLIDTMADMMTTPGILPVVYEIIESPRSTRLKGLIMHWSSWTYQGACPFVLMIFGPYWLRFFIIFLSFKPSGEVSNDSIKEGRF